MTETHYNLDIGKRLRNKFVATNNVEAKVNLLYGSFS